jgi:hypothetical protein
MCGLTINFLRCLSFTCVLMSQLHRRSPTLDVDARHHSLNLWMNCELWMRRCYDERELPESRRDSSASIAL